MRRILLGALIVLASGCAAKKPVEPAPGPETVRVETSHPGPAFFELGPVSGTDGQGCGDDGLRGKRERAVASLMIGLEHQCDRGEVLHRVVGQPGEVLAAACTAGFAQGYPAKPRFSPNSPEQFAAFVKSEIAKWAPVVKASGARVD